MLQPQRVEVFRVEDLAIGFCGEVVFIPRDIIVFFQFIVNSGFGYNLSVVISILFGCMAPNRVQPTWNSILR